MGAERRHSILALITVTVAVLSFFGLSFPLNDWFSRTMPRHQVLQLPAMIVIGLALGSAARRVNVTDLFGGIAVLVLVMGSLVFWMLPRSIDLAVISPTVNRVMHLNMVAAGFGIAVTLRNMPFEVRIAFPGMLASMLIASGLTLRAFFVLLCSSFTIDQQHETGLYLLLIGLALFAATAVAFVRGLRAGPIATGG